MERESTKASKDNFEDDWVKASEARYDSMKHLLQSVRHDIDALTSRIDQTQCSVELLRVDGTSPSVRQQVSSSNSSPLGVSRNGGQDPQNCRPDILANVISGAEEAFRDEYMDIQIRESRTSFIPQYNDDQLLECKVAGASSDQIGDKSWRSPSDFNVHDPFESVRLPNEFTGGATPCSPKQHCNHPAKETDLDDLDLHQFEPDDDSADSLSPAVSPTFENYVTEGVSLNNMLVTKDESGHFQFDPNDSSMKPSIPEEYRVYDNGHALTTIDEASEEIEDDWSSSDMDLSTHSHQPLDQANLVTSSNVIMEVNSGRSIEPGFKTSGESTPGPLSVFTDDDNQMMYTTEYRIKSTSLKNTSDAERTFVGEASTIDGSDPHRAYDHVVVLRPKRVGMGESPVKQRPISAGSLRGYMRNGDGSVTGSLHSVASMLSQESVLSEADSYVTVASRFNTTGSDDMYTTACSDFELPDQHTPNIYVHQDSDECPTLSRKRTKLSKSQRHRPMDFQPQSESSSEDDENEDVLRITEAIVVTPKFSRLPSKMASPKEDVSSTFWGGDFSGTEAKIQPVENISKVTGTPGVISHKRITLRRPKRSSPVHKNFPTDESPNRSDADTKSSDSSSSADEADYDASASITWASRQTGSESGVLPPDSARKSGVSFDKVPCSIQKSSVVASGLLERCKGDRDQDGDIDGNHMVVGLPGALQDSRTINSRFIDNGSSDASGIMVVPKYNLSSQHPVNNTQEERVTLSTEDRQQCVESQTDLARASTHADDSRLAKPNEPVVKQRVDSDFAASQHKQRDPTEIDETKTNVSLFLVSHDPVAATQCPEKACATSTVLSTSGEEINESNESKQDQRAVHQLDGTEDMHGARINHNANPNYLSKQQFGTSHIYNDRTREIAKQNAINIQRLDSAKTVIDGGSRAVLPLGAVLSSAEASAARPSIYSPPPSTMDDMVNKQRAKDTSDVLIQGHQPRPELSSSTVQQRSTITGYSPSPSSKLLNGSNEISGARYADASQAARLFSPSSCLGSKADNEPGESQSYREIPIQSSYVRKIALSVDVPTYQPEDRLRAGNPDTGEQSSYPFTRSDTGNLHTRHRTNVITVENASSMRPITSEQSYIPSFSDDIQAASQRTSRILHGKAELLDAPTKPFADTHVPLSVCRDSSHTGLEETLTDSLAARISGIELSDPSRANSHHAGDGAHVRDQTVFSPLSKTTNLRPMHSQVELMRSPKAVAPVQLDSASSANSSQQRIQSPSPPYSVTRSTGFRSSPPLIRPKWQLKPIPTDNEIRERLRSRSRQRTDTRQSRPVHPELTGSYRPRSSRSDSRYRCTDLDSAIAESKAESSPSKTQNLEVFSDTKQSASLFDLGEHLRKSTKTSYFHQNGSTARSSGIEDATTRKFFGDAKSYSSLLETDIDTGENFERPIILETDVDNLDTLINGQSFTAPTEDYCQPKTRSLFNLAHSYTPGLHRRQTTMDKSPGVTETNTHSPNDLGDNWQRTKSLQGLTHRDRESPIPRQDIAHQNKAGSIGAKGLIERLRERARSTHELRIAQSLTKLRIPEWLDKAECLSRSVVEGAGSKDRDRHRQKELTSELTQTLPSREDDHSRSNLSTLRSLSNVRKVEGPFSPKWLPKSTTIETVAEPTRPRAGISHQPRFIRPSQELRERGESVSRLRPIRSKLYSSMKSLAGAQSNLEKTATDLRPQVAPRPLKTMIMGLGTEMKLSPQDFVPREEQVLGHQHRQVLANANPPGSGSPITQPASNHFDTMELVSPRISSNLLDTACVGHAGLKEAGRIQEDIKPADYDSGTEHSGDLTESSVRKPPSSIIKQVEPVHTLNGTQAQHIQSNRMEVHDRRLRKGPADRFVYSNFDSDSGPEIQSPRDDFSGDQPCSDWHSIDAEGDPESEATDGLDQISDLTCLTTLVDTCASRHQALLANRPSALEHLLTSLGWWPPAPQTEHRYLPPTAAEAISIAAHEFDVDDDSHRTEFIQLLTSPESRRPINLGEFALNQLSGAVQRKQEDGLLYISCGRSECTKSPIQVNQAIDWCACPNCYTLYCSSVCRAIDRRAAHDHPTICSFARAKRVCNRLLRNLAAGQVTGLTALAKTGMTRLGRGGILLPFALVQHAELFLQRARAYSFVAKESIDNSLEYASSCWENKHLPSPGGLMSPPLYLTLKELEELDSTVAKPCQSYNPSMSMVLIVVVCAYELIARSDGRPVHLFKQSLIIPFPVHNAPCISSSQPASPAERPVKLPRTVLTKPVLPQTNGLLSKPDRQAAAAREAYMIRLQRVLRERGVSLRHHHPEIYTQIANYVETGVPFAPIRIVFHDFVLREEVLCTIQPMCDPLLQPTRQMQSRQRPPNELYEEVVLEASQRGSAITEHSPTTSQRHMARPFPETDF
ncbi:hypothetical protein CSKR_200969 [Clonorchis sinensis]|uniref:Apical junction molecule ajm1 alpha/beta domain-containing protein n=1 Tax=Clonorchis sinensis TaxID=79923 RepID=A0A8T1MK40_CLOSI|nr:hypothetical protein CSKR_200969 [Clonorchis sinensis]